MQLYGEEVRIGHVAIRHVKLVHGSHLKQKLFILNPLL